MVDSEPIVTSRHLLGFGGIIHHYAFVETGVKLALSHVIGISFVDMAIICEPYTSLSLKNVSKSLAKAKEPITPEVERFLQIVGDLAKFSRIRNYVAHSQWTTGARLGSIKPTGIDIRDGKARVLGYGEDEKDWTVDDLYAESDALVELSARIRAFLIDTGAADTMLLKIATTP